MAKEEIRGNRKVSASAAVVGGLIIAALSFTAGVVGAGSHRVGDRPATTSASLSQSGTGGVEARSPSDQGYTQKRIPGHSECELQLN